MDRRVHIEARPGLWPPSWPMGLTMLRLLLLPLFLWAVLQSSHDAARPYRWIAVGIFAIMAITDKLDGYLARRLDQSTKLGAVLDPIADKLLIACSVMLLSFEWIAPPQFRIPAWVVIAIYGKDLTIAVGALLLLALVGRITIHPRPLGKASTVLQLSMVLAVLVAPPASALWLPFWKNLTHGLFWAVTGLAALACLDYVVQGVSQLRHGRAALAAAHRKS